MDRAGSAGEDGAARRQLLIEEHADLRIGLRAGKSENGQKRPLTNLANNSTNPAKTSGKPCLDG